MSHLEDSPAGAIVLAPLVVAFPPLGRPGATAIGTAFSLAALSTVLAYLVAFRLIAVAGPVATSAVTYLMPAFGAAFSDRRSGVGNEGLGAVANDFVG